MKNLTVFVMTHNRPEMLEKTLESIFAQTCSDFKLILSDNSSNDETEKLIKSRGWDNRLVYRKRNREYPSIEHFNLVLSEIDTDYFILFHDDDLMLPSYVQTMYDAINGSEFTAVGCNALKLWDNNLSEETFLPRGTNMILQDADDMIRGYINSVYAPYPGYIYSNKARNGQNYELDAGKYSDVTWLLRFLRKGPILWLNDPQMCYRFHSSQDSASLAYGQSVQLIGFYHRECSKSSEILAEIDEYRLYLLFLHYVISLRQGTLSNYEKKHIRKLLRKWSTFHYYPKSLLYPLAWSIKKRLRF